MYALSLTLSRGMAKIWLEVITFPTWTHQNREGQMVAQLKVEATFESKALGWVLSWKKKNNIFKTSF
jgi:hypothetical protein